MKRRGVLIAVVATLALALTAPRVHAQVFMTAQPVPLPSAYPSDWESSHGLMRLLMTNQAGEPVRCELRVKFEQGGDTAGVMVPRQFDTGVTFLTTPQVTDWSRMVFRGALAESMKRTGHLPAKPIRITIYCENMFGMVSNNPIPAVQATITIIPSVPSPPTLMTPADGRPVQVTHPVFTWTPVRLTTGQQVWYQFRLVRVLAGQTPTRAIEANVPLLETFVPTSSLTYPAAAPRLEDGGLYAWRVQSVVNATTGLNPVSLGNVNSNTLVAPTTADFASVGLNEGRSHVRSFVRETPANEPAVAARLRTPDPLGDAATRGGLIDMNSDEPTPPAARRVGASTLRSAQTPADSLALAMLAPSRDVWGPKVTGPRGPLSSDPRGGEPQEPTGEETPTDSLTAAAIGAPAMGAPRRAAIAVDPGAPQGQGVGLPWLRVSGMSVAAGEWYTHSGAGVPSRPSDNGQLITGLTLSTPDNRFRLPLRMLVSGDQVSFRQGLNQFSLSPQWHWGGLHAGNITPGYSSFSLADATLLGGGADVVRDKWYFSFADGRMSKAIRPDTLYAVQAQYARNVMAGRIGLGTPLGNAIEFEVMRARDAEGSLDSRDTLVRVAPAGNMVLGARVRHTVFDTLTTVQVEGALSRYDRNVNADVDELSGGAGGIKLRRRSPLGEVSAALDYVGSGFVTLANSELAPDAIEGRVGARRELVAGKLRVGATVGLRRDDLSGTLGGSTRRRSLGAQVGWQPVQAFGADLDLGVLSSRADGSEARAEMQDVSTSFTVSPHVTWQWWGASQTLTSSLSVQTTSFSELGAAGFSGTRNTSVTAGWQSAATSNLFMNVTGNYVKSTSGEFTSEVSSVGPGVMMTLFGSRAQANLQLQFTETRLTGQGPDRDLAPNIDLRYLVNGRQMLVFKAGMRRYRTSTVGLGDFDERLATVQYSAAL